MKILFVGHLDEGQTSLMRMRALQRLGHDVVGVNTIKPWLDASWAKRQLQRRLQRGTIVQSINEAVLMAARDYRPDLIWAEKQEYLTASTLESLRRLGARLLHFTPDPYFSLSWKRTQIMDEAFPLFDVLVYCKSYERAAYEATGRSAVYMPLGYCDEVHRPRPTNDPHWSCTVGFLGGWEPRRQRMLNQVMRAGTDVKIWGAAWDFLVDGRWSPRRQVILRQLAGGAPFSIQHDSLIAAAYQGGEVYQENYALALSGARIGLGFLRTVCADQHTTRTFEIPACGSMLLADRTDEHQSLFREGQEAEFFSSDEELVDKVDYYRKNENARSTLARAGLQRCKSSGYSYLNRISGVMNTLDTI